MSTATKAADAKKSGNPAFALSGLRRNNPSVTHPDAREGTVTIEGTALKTALLVGILIAAAATVWVVFRPVAGTPIPQGLIVCMVAGLIGGLVLAIWTIVSPRSAPVTAPLYAVFEGLVIGGISAMFEYLFPGIVLQATGITIGVFLAILGLYGSGVIKVTETFKAVLYSAMLAICFVYLVTLVLNLFGSTIPYIHGTGPVGIIFSVIVCIIAALNFAWDFQEIVDAKTAGAPRWFEWYLGFGLLLTLVWLYLEILRLLAKLRSND